MKRVFALLISAGLLMQSSDSFSDDIQSSKLSPALDRLVRTQVSLSSDSLVKILVILDDSAIHNQLAETGAAKTLTRSERLIETTSQLKTFRPRGYDVVKQFLTSISGSETKSYWIIPAFSAQVPVRKIGELERFEAVKLIVEDAGLVYEEPVEIIPAASLSTAVSTHLQMLKVPQLWQRGLTGRGRLICSFDTGVDVGHPALAAKWRGHTSTLSACWFSMVEPDSLPNDAVGHGTHTMGTMVGSEGADTIGVAFDAQWITAGVIDQGRPLSATISDILAAFQWVLNPDGNLSTTDDVPDVVLNSWGVPKGLFAPCDATFWTVIDNVEAAGIVTVFAAGNEGPGAKTMRSPADRATTALNSFAVGAVDNNKLICDFSSRGPSSCDTSQHKPEVVAPGVMIRSSAKGGGYGYMTGTSMAAPFIAGLAALIRQFNPDATVSQIKNAILLSCEDLGPFGDDNSYGYGLPDASQVLNFIPPPTNAVFSVSQQAITDSFTPFPGDTFHLRLTLAKQSGSVNTITGTLKSLNPDEAEVLVNRAGFFFGGTASSAMSVPEFQIRYDENLFHGQVVDFLLELEDGTGQVFDSLSISLTAGLVPNGTIAVLATNRIDFSVSDFGQYGFAPGSIYNAGGQGLRLDGGGNLLYEAGIIVGRNQLLLSTSVRDSLGNLTPSDFKAISPLKLGIDADGGNFLSATMRDNLAEIMIPITIIQKSKVYSIASDGGYIIVEYWLYNHTLENITSVYFGFMSDFDLSQYGDQINYDPSYEMAWQQNGGGAAVGVVGLKNINGFSYLTNDSQKTGMTRQQQFNSISTNTFSGMPVGLVDIMTVTKSGPFTIAPNDSVKIALAIAAGFNTSDLFDNALRARNQYNLSTDIGNEGNGVLPNEFALYQNYPNPFNPNTTISFDLDRRQKIELVIYNMLGQRVKSLYSGYISAGTHRMEWDASDDTGGKVASGVYFYRLVGETQILSRKMTLLK